MIAIGLIKANEYEIGPESFDTIYQLSSLDKHIINSTGRQKVTKIF